MKPAILVINHMSPRTAIKRDEFAYVGIITNKYFHGRKVTSKYPSWPTYISVRRRITDKFDMRVYSDSEHFTYARELPVGKNVMTWFNMPDVEILDGSNPEHESIISDINDTIKTGIFKNIRQFVR